jgi:tight adherence protein B
MTPALELALLAIALVVTGILLRQWLRETRRRRPDLTKLDRLKSAPVDRGAQPEPPEGRVRRKLVAAGLRLSPALFLGVCGLSAGLAFTTMARLLPGWLLPALIALLAAYLPWLALDQWATSRSKRFEKELAYAVSFLVGAVRAGENPAQALVSAAEASRDPVRREFHAVADRLELGMTLERSLQPVLEGYDSPGVRLFVHTLLVKGPSGGDLAPILDKVATTIRERLRLRWRLRSQLAGAKAGTFVVAIVPYAILPVFLLVRPDWFSRLFEDPLGLRLLTFAILLQVAGFLVMRRVLRIEL